MIKKNITNSRATTPRPPIIRFVDEHGRDCVRVPLDPAGNAYATALEGDYQAVRDAGATGTWFLNGNGSGQQYVRTKVQVGKGNFTLATVARIIMSAGARSTIYYANKDRLDLRPENLFWHRNGNAKRCDVKLAERGAQYRQERQQTLESEHRAAA